MGPGLISRSSSLVMEKLLASSPIQSHSASFVSSRLADSLAAHSALLRPCSGARIAAASASSRVYWSTWPPLPRPTA